MSFDEQLAARIRKALGKRVDVVEKRMFGGLCFMVDGALCCGVMGSELLVRVGPAQLQGALAQPHARPMDFTGRPSKNAVYVAPGGLRTDAALARWLKRGLAFVSEGPAIRPRRPRGRPRAHRP